MASSLTRGPLPAGVYWRRRLVLALLALVLVVGVARVLGGGSDASSDDDGVAAQVAGAPSSTTPGALVAPTRKPGKGQGQGRKNRPSATPTPTPTPLAVPDGPCDEADLEVTPSAVDAVAGRDVVLLLSLRTLVDPACTWRVSSGTLSVKLTSGDDDIWSSQQCPAAVPVKDVVVRSAEATTVALVWNAKRSDDDCTHLTAWALPGDYHVVAAALGGEPTDVQFTLEAPVADVVTQTATPSQAPSPSRGGSAQPSGAVEPDGR